MGLFRKSTEPDLTPESVPYSLNWTLPGGSTAVGIHMRLLRQVETDISTGASVAGLLLGTQTDSGAPRQVWLATSQDAGIPAQGLASGVPMEALSRTMDQWPSGPERRMWAVGCYLLVDGAEDAKWAEELALLRLKMSGKPFCALLVEPSETGLSATLLVWERFAPKPERVTFPLSSAELRYQGFGPLTPQYFGSGTSREMTAPQETLRTPPAYQVPAPAPAPAPPAVRMPPPAPAPIPAPAAVPGLRGAELRSIGARTWVPIALCGLLLTAGLAWWWSERADSFDPPAATGAAKAEGLDLRITRKGTDLQITWNRKSEFVQRATGATLYITDGRHRTNIALDRQQLQTTEILYVPRSSDIDLRLEVQSESGPIARDNLRVIQPGAAMDIIATRDGVPIDPAPPLITRSRSDPPPVREVARQPVETRRSSQPVRNAQSEPPPSRAVQPTTPPERQEEPETLAGIPRIQLAVDTPAQQTVPQTPAPRVPPTRLQTQLPPSKPPASQTPAAGSNPPASQTQQSSVQQAPVQQPPVQQAKLQQPPVQQPAIQQSPIQQGQAQQSPPVSTPKPEAPKATAPPASAAPATREITTIPPVPVKQVAVVVPPVLRSLLFRETDIELVVLIDDKGKVTGTRAEKESGLRAQLLEIARNTARLWQFSPARIDGKPVSSEHRLRFRFKP